DKEAVAKSTELIKDLYKDEFKKAADDPAVAKDLAATLLKEGRTTNDDLSLKFAALSLARDVAAKAGEHTAALEAIDELGKHFIVDTSTMKSAALAAAAKNVTEKDAGVALAEMALQMVEEALGHDNYEAALSLVDTASKAAAAAKSLGLASRAKKAETDVK